MPCPWVRKRFHKEGGIAHAHGAGELYSNSIKKVLIIYKETGHLRDSLHDEGDGTLSVAGKWLFELLEKTTNK